MRVNNATRYRVLRNQIAILEDDCKNTIGGSKAFFSGNKTELKPEIVAKIAKLQSRIDALPCDSECD